MALNSSSDPNSDENTDDLGDGQSDDDEANVTTVPATPNPVVDLSIEGENAEIFGGFEKLDNGSASNGQYIVVPDGTAGRTAGAPDPSQKARFTFSVNTAGTYKLNGRILAPGGGSDSFYVQVDGEPAAGIQWNIASTSDVFRDDELGDTFDLTAGNHTVDIFLREDGTGLDKLELLPQ